MADAPIPADPTSAKPSTVDSTADSTLPRVDVLVVGGGPVGVATALLLAKRGFTTRVIERSTEIYDLPRAIVMDDEIQRVLQNVGLTEKLRAITTPLAGAEFVKTDGERIIGVELPADANWPLGHHPTVSYYQPELEAFLREAAVDAGVDLQLGVEARGVTQDQRGVRVEVQTVDSGAIEIHEADWLVAADGASSPIRKRLGIEFVDQGFDQGWLVLDVRLKRPVPTLPPFVQQICDPARPTTYVVGHADYRRWEFQLQDGETAEAMTDPERVWSLLSPWLTPDDAVLIRAVVYRFHATVADRMRADRIFLAGDAAHQMPPFLGQGLCSGIRDGANLAWKLQLVRDHRAPDTLLDTYGDERLPHAAGVVAHAVDTGRLIDQLAGRTSSGTGIDAAYGGSRPFPKIEHGVRFGDHAAVGKQVPQPKVDGRPLDELLGDGFALVVEDAETAQPVGDRWSALARVVVVPGGTLPFLLAPGGAIIVRPDRYVAAVCTDQTSLVTATNALTAMLHVPRSKPA